jgi:hypothetical protein
MFSRAAPVPCLALVRHAKLNKFAIDCRWEAARCLARLV